MERFVRMSLDELDELCVTGCRLDEVQYPPGLEPTSGSLEIRPLRQGGVKVEVDRCDGATEDFVLSVLFETGGCIFSGGRALAEFFRTAVATAFGVESEPIPPGPATADGDSSARQAAPEPEPRPEPEAVDDDPWPPSRRRRNAPARCGRALVPPDKLAKSIAREVYGQRVALTVVARAVANHLAKPSPSRPETIVLVGPTGTGKTSTIEALPAALADLGAPDRHVFRIDCNELTNESDIRRVLGAPPSYVGYVEEPPLVAALRRPGCIVLLDEVEKATRVVFDVFLSLLDAGRLTAPDGETVDAPGAIVAMTTNEGADDLVYRLRDVPVGGRAEQEACREHLLRAWWPIELVGRIGTFAVYEPLGREVQRGVAEREIHRLAKEFGFVVTGLEPVLADVVWDLGDSSEIGARAFAYATRDLLADAFAEAARSGVSGGVRLEAGPPPRVVASS
jgi:hypothetical protein